MLSFHGYHLPKIGPWGLITETIGKSPWIREILESTTILYLIIYHIRESSNYFGTAD